METGGIWFCYMLECGDGSLYVGVAKDPGQRVKRHNWGVGSRHTALRRPVKLVWQEEHASQRWARSGVEGLAEREEAGAYCDIPA
jgi:putative endonuclease